MSEQQVYLDHNATTPVAEPVWQAMEPYFRGRFGNASSIHWAGRAVQNAVEDARDQAAELLGCRARDLFFTSGGTESNNTAISAVGLHLAEQGRARRVITCATEHKAILDPGKYLAKHHGFELVVLPVDALGRLDPESLRAAIDDRTALVSVMMANNELGTIQPIRELCAIAHEHGAVFHTDAVQAVGKIPVDIEELGVDLLSMSAHKLYGPKGVGLLYQRRRRPFAPLIRGGGQEKGRRSGTYNAAGIVGLGAACALAHGSLAEEQERLGGLRDRLEDGILAGLEGVEVNGDRAQRTPNTSNLRFAGVEGEALLLTLDLHGIAVSTGSACSSASSSISHVLKAIGREDTDDEGAIRFSLGRLNDAAQIDYVVETTVREVKRLRALVEAGAA